MYVYKLLSTANLYSSIHFMFYIYIYIYNIVHPILTYTNNVIKCCYCIYIYI